MLSAMTLDQLSAKMKCNKCGKRPERYYPANQSDTPGFVQPFDALVSPRTCFLGRVFLLCRSAEARQRPIERASDQERPCRNPKGGINRDRINRLTRHLKFNRVAAPRTALTLRTIRSFVLLSKSNDLGWSGVRRRYNIVSLLETTFDFVGLICFEQVPVHYHDGSTNRYPKSTEYQPQPE